MKETLRDPPPAYDTTPPDITSAFSNLNLNASDTIPTPSECLAHLKLLEAFFLLREDIGTTDGLCDIRDDSIPASAPEEQKNQLIANIREKRWAVYVTNASLRFERWWEASTGPKSQSLKQQAKTAPLSFNQDNLPPLGEPPVQSFKKVF